jgi:hypothetical protein
MNMSFKKSVWHKLDEIEQWMSACTKSLKHTPRFTAAERRHLAGLADSIGGSAGVLSLYAALTPPKKKSVQK